jgi:hypothetical protein
MTLYITPDNKLHDDADGYALTLPSWPQDARLATQEEIEAILNPIVSPLVPQSVTMRQARLALLGDGLLDDVNAAINTLPSPQKEAAQVEWEYAQDVQRNQPLVLMLLPALGLTDEEADQLFIKAEKL